MEKKFKKLHLSCEKIMSTAVPFNDSDKVKIEFSATKERKWENLVFQLCSLFDLTKRRCTVNVCAI